MGDPPAAPFDAVIEAFNADPTPGPRAVVLHRLMRETGLKRRVVFDVLVECGWDEVIASEKLVRMARGQRV